MPPNCRCTLSGREGKLKLAGLLLAWAQSIASFLLDPSHQSSSTHLTLTLTLLDKLHP